MVRILHQTVLITSTHTLLLYLLIYFGFFSGQGFSVQQWLSRKLALIDQASLELIEIRLPVSRMLGLKVCATTAWHILNVFENNVTNFCSKYITSVYTEGLIAFRVYSCIILLNFSFHTVSKYACLIILQDLQKAVALPFHTTLKIQIDTYYIETNIPSWVSSILTS